MFLVKQDVALLESSLLHVSVQTSCLQSAECMWQRWHGVCLEHFHGICQINDIELPRGTRGSKALSQESLPVKKPALL